MIDAVGKLIREIAAEEVLPRWRNLKDHEVRDKTKGDPVTEADLACERRLTVAFKEMLPGSLVVGEEAVFEDATVLARLEGDAPVWVIDPVDGTKNFTQGTDVFAVMVALVQKGVPRAAWIYAPVADEMVVAESGGGAFLNGARLSGRSAPETAGAMRGAIHTRYLESPIREVVLAHMDAFGANEQLYCAGLTYVALARGALDHALYWKANPWDHIMGALIVAEAGGRSAYLDGETYRAQALDKRGIIAVADAAVWEMVHKTLFPKGVPAGSVNLQSR